MIRLALDLGLALALANVLNAMTWVPASVISNEFSPLQVVLMGLGDRSLA